LIKKAWVKFNDMSVECICDDNDRKCKDDKLCKEYVIRFTEIERAEKVSAKVSAAAKHLEKETNNLQKSIKKFESQISKSIKKFKI
jgi:hypothetical protein